MKRVRLTLPILLAVLLGARGTARAQEAHSGAIIGGRMPIPLPSKEAMSMTLAAHANNAFAFDLYTKLRSVDGGNNNLFFSPYSLSSALTMARIGAAGATADQMSTTLHLPPADLANVEAGYQSLNSSLAGQEQPGFTLSIANALWGQKGEPFLADYLDVVKTDFGADLTPVDFLNQPEAVRTQINDWVAKKTQDKIKDLLIPGSITSSTKLVLSNAVYFKGKWSETFDASLTQQGDFNRFAKQVVKADMMHGSGHYLYAENLFCQAVQLPYAGDQLAMLVLLPKVAQQPANEDRSADQLRRAMEQLEGSLDGPSIERLMGQLSRRRVKLALPKWHATQAFDLGQTLTDMGMKQAFSPAADFSGINGQKGLFLSDVVHKAFVAVDEQGTEAAAASAAIAPGGVALPEKPVEFTADHPFVYLIIHQPSHTVLFAGRLCDPSATE